MLYKRVSVVIQLNCKNIDLSTLSTDIIITINI